jgi:gamma-glutamyltranspeptidase/glutathione hydrolase
MGHTVKSVDGAVMGGVQVIMILPDSTVPPAAPGAAVAPGGYYRAGSDFRKDGQAVGW